MNTLTTDEMLERLRDVGGVRLASCENGFRAAIDFYTSGAYRLELGNTPHEAVSALYAEAVRLGLIELKGRE